jgi:hypothetical protein
MKGFDFICPFMRVPLIKACNVNSCQYYSNTTQSHCIWVYINSKNSITPTELAIILNKNPIEIENTLKQIKIKLAQARLKQYLNNHFIHLHYCHKCGRAFNLKKKKTDEYVCVSHCRKNNVYEYLESFYKKPISHILVAFASLINTNMMSNLLQVPNKIVKDTFIKVFGDSSLLVKFKDSKETTILKKRTKKLKLRSLNNNNNKVPEDISFNTLATKIKKF